MAQQILWVSHFAGCGGANLGAKQAGFTPILGIEYDHDIAELYRHNVGNVLCHPYLCNGFVRRLKAQLVN